MLVTNLFRDQLDRYFEIDQLARRIGDAIEKIDPRVTLVLNADDPIVAWLGQRHRGPVMYFGVDDPKVGGRVPQAISDATRCPRCRAALHYARVVLAHEGDWSCPSCGLVAPRARCLRDACCARPRCRARSKYASQARAPSIRYGSRSPACTTRTTRSPRLRWRARSSIALPTAALAIANFRPAFGRLEEVTVDGRDLRLILVKNPAGFNAAIGALLETGRRPRLLAALNDRDADSRDVSWIWDADFEALAAVVEHAVVTGIRSRDLANRLKYAGVARERVEVVDQWGRAIDRAIGAAPQGGEVVVLATYTAMLALRDELARRGHVANFWED